MIILVREYKRIYYQVEKDAKQRLKSKIRNV